MHITEIMTPDPVVNQMQQPAQPEQMSTQPAIKPDAQISNATAAANVPLKELFDVKAPVRQINQSRYVFTVDGKQFQVDFDPASTPGAVECSLSRLGDVGYDKTPFDPMNDMGSRAIVVYSTFVAINAKYMKMFKPAVVFWYGFTPEQQRLYDKLSTYLSRQVPDYTIQKNGVTIGFVRNQPQQQPQQPPQMQQQPAAAPQGMQEGDEVLSRDEVNRIEHDKMARYNPKSRRMTAVAMPGAPTHSPTYTP